MDTWTRGGGNRGRGRGGGGRGGGGGGRGEYNNSNGYNNNDNRQPYYSDSNAGTSNIASRLGPIPGGPPAFQQQPQHQQYQHQQGQGRGRGRGGYQNNSLFNNDYNSSQGGYQNDHYQSSPRGRQQQTFTSRGRGRGGGSYRGSGGGKGQFTRDFVDDDIDMAQELPEGAPVIMVTGYPPGTERDLLSFLHRKTKMEWEELNVQHENGVTYITVDGPKTAEILLRKDGFTFSGSILSITLADGNNKAMAVRQKRTQRSVPPSHHQQQQVQGGRSNVLAEFLQERWDPQHCFLNLDDLPPTSHSIAVVISRLLTEASKIYGSSVVTVSFARNKLWSVQPLNKLANFFPGLRNLSLQENDISEFRGLDPLKNKLPQLSELVLLGNPLQAETSPDIYTSEILRRFPTLAQLDFQPVQQQHQQNQQQQLPLPLPQQQQQQQQQGTFKSASPNVTGASIPIPVKPSFFDQDSSRQTAQDLLSRFFPFFDSNRSGLTDLYDTQSTFSINVSRSCYAQTTWGQGQRMISGNENISKRFAVFPPTIHDLSRAENFMMDAWQVPGSFSHPVLLYLTVHGSFREASGELSFDRVFLIAPAPPGSRALAAGWHYVILSDSLILRNFSDLKTLQAVA